MSKSDDYHFETYREQTKLKHELLTQYLPAYFRVLQGRHTNLVFIDGFAGRGYYMENGVRRPGSPVLAMELIASDEALSSRVKCIFVEIDAQYGVELEKAVEEQTKILPLTKPPQIFKLGFTGFMASLREHLASSKAGLAPTFLFVDPCGVDGVKLEDLADILARDYCELFLFLNYDGINRIAGAAAKLGSSPTLSALFGSQARVDELITALSKAKGPLEREEIIVACFSRSLREAAGAEYLLPFRVEHEGKSKTSHYLLHATKHPLGFKIMKSVMAKAARTRGTKSGLELLQSTNRAGELLYSHPSETVMRACILEELSEGPRPVSLFRNDWVSRHDDMFSDEDYKRVLLELEASQKIVVLDKHKKPKPAEKRMRDGNVTLGETCWVQLV